MSHIQWPKQILIVDQQDIFVEGLNTILRNSKSTESVKVVMDKAACFQYLLHHQPNLILIDANLPQFQLKQLLEYMHARNCSVPVIVMSNTTDYQVLLDCIALSISGYLLKTCSAKELLEGIIDIMNGQIFYCAKTKLILQQLVVSGQYHPHRKLDKQEFNAKEKSILKLLCSEYTSKEIAGQLNMSARTVESYRKLMQKKTGSKNSAGLILYAIRNGIVDLKASSLPFSISV